VNTTRRRSSLLATHTAVDAPWLFIHRIHRNHHGPEDSDGVSSHRLMPISPTFYISHFQMITGFRLQSNWNMLLKCVNGAAVAVYYRLVNRNKFTTSICCGFGVQLIPIQMCSKKGKFFPYTLPSVGPGADPGVQAVSPQVAWSESRHIPSSSLPLLSARPAFTFVALTRRRYL